MTGAYCAGAARLPFGVLRGYIGTDLPAQNPRIRKVECPFTGERLAAVPALNPDVTVLHAQRADRAGNVALNGIVGAQREAALAATTLLVTVEEIVETLPAAMNAIVLPHWVVTTVVHCPGGAYPSYAHGYYERDNDFYVAWDAMYWTAPIIASSCINSKRSTHECRLSRRNDDRGCRTPVARR